MSSPPRDVVRFQHPGHVDPDAARSADVALFMPFGKMPELTFCAVRVTRAEPAVLS